MFIPGVIALTLISRSAFSRMPAKSYLSIPGRNLRQFKVAAMASVLAISLCGAWQASSAQSAAVTATSLAVTSGGSAVTTTASGSVVTLTATVKAGAAAVTAGQVNFCDASAKYCTDIHVLGTAQLTSAGTATLKLRPGIGSHSYKAVFAATKSDGGSSSADSALAVTGTVGPFATTTSIAEAGSWGAYSLGATVTETGGTAAPTGAVSFLDSNHGNAVLGTGSLGAGTPGLSWVSPAASSADTAAPVLVVGDFNGDGIPDVALPEEGTYKVKVLLGKGDGTFAAPISSTLADVNPTSIVTGDFNGDGILDLAIADNESDIVTVLLGNGDGTFTAAASSSTVGSGPSQIVVADFNGDGIADLAVVNFDSIANGTVSILLGNGDGTFTVSPSSPAAGEGSYAITAADFNGDGKVDLAVVNQNGVSLTILLGNGDGTFDPAASPEVTSVCNGIASGDFNGDGVPDLAVTCTNGGTLEILLGNGDGTFTAAPAFSYGSLSPSAVVVADFDEDGKADLAVLDDNYGGVDIFLGNGDGTFRQLPANLPAGYDPRLLAVGDFNVDGRMDVLTENNLTGQLLVYLTEPTQTASASAEIGLPVAGQHLVYASYGGNSSYNASASGTTPLWGVPPATTTALTVTAGGAQIASVAAGTVITLTATIKAGSSPVTAGEVNFCDASAATCTDIHLLGTAALSSSGVTAYKFVPGPGSHSYKAMFVQDGYGLTSSSASSSLTVGPAPAPVYTDSATITQNGVPGDYSLTATVVGVGGSAPPTGSVSFVDTSFSNNVLATATLGSSTPGVGWLVSQTPTTGTNPVSEVSGDFNGDGIPDLAVIWTNNPYGGPYSVTILIGKGDGTFTPGSTIQPAGLQSYPQMIAGDFNGDGKTDLAILSWNGSSTSYVTTLPGNGDGTFGTPQTETVLSQNVGGDGIPGFLIAADFNGDGKLDLAVVGDYVSSGGAIVLLGNGDGTFTVGQTLNSSSGYGLIATGDFNGDGIPDLVTTNYFDPGGFTVFLGKGDGTFRATPTSPTLDYFPTSMVIGDFNGDGLLDLAFSDLNGIEIFLGNGDGTFKETSASPISVNGELFGLSAGDFNHDGKLDLAGYDSSSMRIDLLLGAGDGTFAVNYTGPNFGQSAASPLAVAEADFNGDGVPDLALLTANATASDVLLAEPIETASATVNNVAPAGAYTHNVEASYLGDPNYPASISATTPLYAGVAPPVISRAAGTITSAQSITITDPTAGSTIYYQLTGAMSTNGFVVYIGPIPMQGQGTVNIQAYATETGYDQSIYAAANYVLNFSSTVATPVISLAPGTYASAQTVTITDSTPGAAIYYTTNGTYPWTGTTLYAGPITVSTSEIITALSVAPGYTNSGFASAQYLISSSSTRFMYTIAGNETAGYSGDGGPATFAELNNTAAVAVDAAGNVYLSDSQDNVVRRVAAGTGIITTIAGTGAAAHTGDNGPASSAELWAPGPLAIDPFGNLFIGETGDSVVRRIDAVTGVITTFAGDPTGTGALGGPANNFPLAYVNGLACDAAGDLYIAEQYQVLQVNASSGNIQEIAGFSTGASFIDLAGIAVDKNLNIYVSDEVTNKIWVIRNGGIATIFAGGEDFAVNGGDGGPATEATFYFPQGLAVDAAGDLYIADEFDNAIREVNTSGIINTIAGVYEDGYTDGGDGSPANEVGVSYPQVLAADAAGDVFIADQSARILEATAPTTPPTKTAGTPVFSLAAGSYADSQTLTMTEATPDAEVHVTLDGSTPTTSGQGYHGPINITGNVTVQAVAVAPGYLPSTATSATYTFTTPPTALIYSVAGNGKIGFGGAGGPATSAELRSPEAVTFDAAGNLYIADSSNYVVWKVAANTGIITVVAGTGTYGNGVDGGQATATALNYPTGVAVDKAGNLYIADSTNERIRKVSAQTGIMTTIAGPGTTNVFGDNGPATAAYIGFPYGMTLDSVGNLYFAAASRIRRIDAQTGIITTVAGTGNPGPLGDGGLATAARLDSPEDVTLDSAGNLYISDSSDARIRKVDAGTGIISTIAGTGVWGNTGDGGLATAAEIAVTEGIVVDVSGNVYVSSFGDTIRRIDPKTGIITAYAGNGYFDFSGDGGQATMAGINGPQGLTLDASGNLYLADSGNSRVREIISASAAVKPAMTLTPSASSITTAQALTVTVALSGGSSAAAPTGSVTLSGGGFSSAVTLLSTGSATIGIPAGTLAVGSDTLTVIYEPDDESAAKYQTLANSTTVAVSVSIGTATATVSATPAVAIVTNDQSVTVNITVAGGGGQPTPTGTVTLSSGSYSAQQTLSSGAASFDIAAGVLASGQDTLTASYSGDATFATANATTTVTVSPITMAIPAPAPVSAGGSATETVTFAAGSNYSGTLNLACTLTTSPSGAQSLPTCSLNPASLTLAAGGNGATKLTINTTAASGSALYRPSQRIWGLGGGAVLAVVLFIGVPRRRRWISLVFLLATVVGTCTIGCGGGGSSGGGGQKTGSTTPATTAGNYVFTVTATDSTDAKVTISTTVSITVQ
jgi:sugar lactone lactonase YvrE